MSRMNAPEMEVVRFKENDVVARSIRFGYNVPGMVSLANFSGNGDGDGTFYFCGQFYDVDTFQDAQDTVIAVFNSLTNSTADNMYFMVTTTAGPTMMLDQLIEADTVPQGDPMNPPLTIIGADAAFDGDYIWKSMYNGNPVFVRQ